MHRLVLLVQAVLEVVAVGDAVAVGDDERWAGVGLGLTEGLQGLLRVRTEGHPGNIDRAVGDGLHGHVLLGGLLAAGGELGDGTQRCRLGGLTTSVGVHLGVHHQDVDVTAGGEHVVHAARTDVVGPAVTADDPHRATQQVIGDTQQVAYQRGLLHRLQLVDELGDTTFLVHQVVLGELRGVEQVVDELGVELVGHGLQVTLGQPGLHVGGQPHAQTELGIVLEQRVRPGRSTSVGVLAPGGGRQVAAVDRRAAGGIGHLGTVTEELGDEFDVGRLTAAGTGAGELEQRLEELGATHGGEVHPGPVVDRQGVEELDVLALIGLVQVLGQVDGLAIRASDRMGRACLDAQTTAGALVGHHLQGVARLGQTGGVELGGLEGLRGALQGRLLVVLGANDAVRAHEGTVSALDAGLRVPLGDDVGEGAVLETGRTGWVGAVGGQAGDR